MKSKRETGKAEEEKPEKKPRAVKSKVSKEEAGEKPKKTTSRKKIETITAEPEKPVKARAKKATAEEAVPEKPKKRASTKKEVEPSDEKPKRKTTPKPVIEPVFEKPEVIRDDKPMKRKRLLREDEPETPREGFASAHRSQGEGPKTVRLRKKEDEYGRGRGNSRSSGRDDGERRSSWSRESRSDDRPKRRDDDRGERRPFKSREEGSFDRPPRRRDEEGGERRPYKPREERSDDRPPRRRDDDRGERRPYKPREERSDDRPPRRRDDDRGERRPYKPREEKSYDRPSGGRRDEERGRRKDHDHSREYGHKKPSHGKKRPEESKHHDGLIRLNKYIADSGMCSRREADEMIVAGAVRVNGQICDILGTRVHPDDKVQIGDQTLSREIKRYVLLNKPKDYITTTDDPEGRNTVINLVRDACRERIYPVGRLDRNTSGVLLLTNDGDMTKKLTHPSHRIRKVYHVVIDQSLASEDFQKIEEGMELDDGFIKVDAIEFVSTGRKELGIELHSGKNRIVRRIFEQLGYTVVKLDRVVFAGLTKKDLPRGRWRHLTKEEINFLKML